jgi:hypothetical protein
VYLQCICSLSYPEWGSVVVKALRYKSDGPGIDSLGDNAPADNAPHSPLPHPRGLDHPAPIQSLAPSEARGGTVGSGTFCIL